MKSGDIDLFNNFVHVYILPVRCIDDALIKIVA